MDRRRGVGRLRRRCCTCSLASPDVRRVGIGVLAGNIAFAVLVAVVLVAGWLPLTELGVVVTITFTAVSLAFAYAQYLGVRRLA